MKLLLQTISIAALTLDKFECNQRCKADPVRSVRVNLGCAIVNISAPDLDLL